MSNYARICSLSSPTKHRITLYLAKKYPKTCVCAIVKSVRWYFLFRFAQTIIAKAIFGTPLPLFLLPLSVYVFPVKRGQPHPPNVTVAACSLYANISELINTELHSYTIMPKSALLCEHNAHYYL